MAKQRVRGRDTLSPALREIASRISEMRDGKEAKKMKREVAQDLRKALLTLIHNAPKGESEPTFSVRTSYIHPQTGKRVYTRVRVRNGRPSERLWGQHLEDSFVSKVNVGRHAKMPTDLKFNRNVRFDPTYAIDAQLNFDHPTVKPMEDSLLEHLIEGTNPHTISSRTPGNKLHFWYGPPLRWRNATHLLAEDGIGGYGNSVLAVSHPGVDPKSVSPKFNNGDFLTPTIKELSDKLEKMFYLVMAEANGLLYIRSKRSSK